MIRRALAVVALLLLAVPASGQGWSMTTWFQQTIAVQSARLDAVKAAQDTAQIDPNMRGWIDYAIQWQDGNNNTFLRVVGWGFECGQLDIEALDVRLNGFLVDGTPLIQRYPRGDVAGNPGLSGWCASIPLYSGLILDVPLGQLLPSTYYVRLRLWNTLGHSIETNTVAVAVS